MNDELPTRLYYTQTHEWLALDDEEHVTVGVTEHAQEQLGELVFVELPTVEDEVEAGQDCCVLESVKAASDVYAPVSGVITQVNETLADNPEHVNESPYDQGWLFQIKMTEREQLDNLLSNEQYQTVIDNEE